MPIVPSFLNDISLRQEPVTSQLPGSTASGVLWHAAPNRFLLNVPRVARYLIEDGRNITYEPSPGVEPAVIASFFRTTPLAALLYQRGLMAIHAACASNKKGALLLAGDSGVGKSALLAALVQRGWTMLADELTAITMNGQETSFVTPSFSEIALWPDTVEKLGLAKDHLPHADANRLVLSTPKQLDSGPCPLLAIYYLAVHGKDEVKIMEIHGAKKFRALGALCYNSHIADALLDRVAYMRYAAAITSKISIKHMYHPRGKWCIPAMADLIEKDMA